DLSRGATLGAADIAADSSADPAAIEGWVTQRVVRRGEVLHEPAITRPSLVKAGTPVHLQATVDGVTVSRDGTAITAGSLGDQVRVRLDAQRTVTAVVAGPATVKLP
ncbi:MAG: flagellar basal body P-ring formation protein FlgA, partial [Gemmatimonadetes bacterium]|nr:flagellar basal body P-ring formation protein FlgA [Gemmatimonadota bacterium]